MASTRVAQWDGSSTSLTAFMRGSFPREAPDNMDRSNAIDEVIREFMGDLTQLTRRVAMDAVRSALTTSDVLRSPPSATQPVATARPKANGRPVPPANPVRPSQAAGLQPKPVAASPHPPNTSARVADVGPKPEIALLSAKPARRVAAHPGLIVVPAKQSAPVDEPKTTVASASDPVVEPSAPGSGPSPGQGTNLRALVLEAIRTLVRPTAGELAKHCGVPIIAIHGALRGLVLNNQVAKTDTARGNEYSLVSSGEVRPFKRSKSTLPPPPAPTGTMTAEASARAVGA
jgi:hypothetical protein